MSVLTEDLRQKIRDYLPRYPSKQAVTLPALHLVQDALRCVPLEAMREIADILDLSPAEIRDTMTFYGFFRDQERPLGRTRLWVCRSLPCMLCGAEDLLAHVCDRLGIRPGQTTRDGAVTLEFAECLGMCEGAPCVLVDDRLEGPLTRERAEQLLTWLRQRRGVERASSQLLQHVQRKGRQINFATPGSDELRMLRYFQANASVGGENYAHLILQEDARKIEVLEEFLHGTQERIGIGGSRNVLAAEMHVKRFMLRHRRLLGISEEDAKILRAMLGEGTDA